MKNQLKPDLRTKNGGKKGLTKFPNGFVRVELKLRPEEKEAFGDEKINDVIRAMIRERYRLDIFPDGFEENKDSPYFEGEK